MNLKNEIQPQKSRLKIHKSKDSKIYFISASLIAVTLSGFQQALKLVRTTPFGPGKKMYGLFVDMDGYDKTVKGSPDPNHFIFESSSGKSGSDIEHS